jgi:hypothetical protein
MTSDLTLSAAPTNINELRAKNPEPTHPDRDPTTQPASLLWPRKGTGLRKESAEQRHGRHEISKLAFRHNGLHHGLD